jgi:hypothetical protein
MILIVRSTFSATDGRVQNHLKAFVSLGCETMIIDWPRTKHEQMRASEMNSLNVKSFTLFSGSYGNFFKSILGRAAFSFYVLSIVFRNRNLYKKIILSDLDTAFLIVVLRLFFKGEIIFDIYDHYSDVLRDNKVVKFIENKIIQLSSKVIICAEWREKLVPQEFHDKLVVIENFSSIESTQTSIERFNVEDKIKLLYIGVLQSKIRGLEDLIEAILDSSINVELTIGGFGPLEEKLLKLNSSKIVFVGSVMQDQVMKFISNTDIIVGFYYLKGALHHQYAAPNKFYEHLKYGKALITNKGTEFSKIVEVHNTGYVIEEGLVSMKNLIENLNKDEIGQKALAATNLWPSYLNRNLKSYKRVI